jgi:hypothetical protein
MQVATCSELERTKLVAIVVVRDSGQIQTRRGTRLIRSLVSIFVLNCLLLIGVIANNYRQYAAELTALRRLEPSGWYIVHDVDAFVVPFSGPRQNVFAAQRWHGPCWLKTLCQQAGAPIFYRTVKLTLNDTTIDDAAIEALSTFPDLKRIDLRNANVIAGGDLSLQELFPNVEFDIIDRSFLPARKGSLGGASAVNYDHE